MKTRVRVKQRFEELKKQTQTLTGCLIYTTAMPAGRLLVKEKDTTSGYYCDSFKNQPIYQTQFYLIS